MFQVTVKNVEGISTPFKAKYGWSLGDLLSSLLESFGDLELTVEKIDVKKEENNGEENV